jgi:prepilin-type N-terminal cleavage/methylation domain-containing protein
LQRQEVVPVRSRSNSRIDSLRDEGYTLVELLVVIVILGILAAVVVFAVSGITNKGTSNPCAIEVRTVNTALQAFYAQSATSRYPTGRAVSGPSGMFTQLETAGLLQQSAPAATARYRPTYDGAGNYAASCP